MPTFLFSLTVATALSVLIVTVLGHVMARSGFPLAIGGRRFSSVDGLRGWLALSVMVYHFYIWVQIDRFGGAWAVPKNHLLSQMGAGAVGLFFMTTGLVFYPRILTGWRNTSWSSVYITRIFRILPMVILSLLAVTSVIYIRTDGVFDLAYFKAAAYWISSWGEPALLGYHESGRINAYVLWSLWYEWLFYIALLPACAFAMDIAKKAALPTWAVPVGFLLAIVVARLLSKIIGYQFEALRMLPLFALGMIAYELQSKEIIKEILASRLMSAVSIVGMVAGITMTGTPYGISMPAFALFFVCIACGNSMFGVMNTRSARVIGEVSFGIYLLHGVVLDILFVDAAPLLGELTLQQVSFVLCLAIAIIVPATALTYLLIERNSIIIGKSLAQWWDGRKLRLSTRELDVAP